MPVQHIVVQRQRCCVYEGDKHDNVQYHYLGHGLTQMEDSDQRELE